MYDSHSSSSSAIDYEAMIASSLKELTPREAEVLGLIAHGKSSREIARTLGKVSHETVSTHIRRILCKMNIDSRLGLVAIAIRFCGHEPTAEQIYEYSTRAY